MPMCRSFLLLIVLLPLTLATASAAEEFGDISGQFVVEGPIEPRSPIAKAGGVGGLLKDIPDEQLVVDKATKGLANVFVYLRRAPAAEPLPPEPKEANDSEVVVTVKDFRYEPHAIIVRTGQKLRFVSRSPDAHTVLTQTFANPHRNFLLKAKDDKGFAIEFEKGESFPMPVRSGMHPWMRATVLVLDHPYAAVTDKEGKFTIRGLPAGEHSIRVWHENPGYLDREWKVQVVGGKTTTLPAVQVPSAKLEKKAATGPTVKPTI